MRKNFRVTEKGASQNELDELQRQLGYDLPDYYLLLLKQTNGAEWCVHDIEGNCLRLWKTQEIVKSNEDYQIQRYLPKSLAIGSDGGGRAIILDCSVSEKPNDWPIFLNDFGDLDRDEFVPVATDFLDWVKKEFRLPS